MDTTEIQEDRPVATSAPSSQAGAYERLPYVSLPVSYTQPTNLAALVQLFGLSAPSLERPRVLELGCASGGNLIPLASRHREGHFLGLDLSRRHVGDAQHRIAAFGLRNIEIRQADIATVDLSRERFDFVICHGVFSWTPPFGGNFRLEITDASFDSVDRSTAVSSYA